MVRSPRDRTRIRTQAIRRQAVVAAGTEAILSREAILSLPREAIPPVAEAAAVAEAAEAAEAAAAVGSVSERHHPAVPTGDRANDRYAPIGHGRALRDQSRLPIPNTAAFRRRGDGSP
jgi:hypothetical protein